MVSEILVLMFLGVIFYLYKTSKNEFFFQDEYSLKKAREMLKEQLVRYGRSSRDVARFLKSYDWFCKNPERYDGSTIVRDLFDVKHNGERLSASSMYHDYIYIHGANKNYIKITKANILYIKDLLYNGKGFHIERLIGLTIISIFFVPLQFLKKIKWIK